MAVVESSRWFDVESVPESHTFPVEDRPGNEPIPLCKTIPVISIGTSQKQEIVHDVLKACQDLGFFQVTDHGIPEHVIGEAVAVLSELFSMSGEEIAKDASANGYYTYVNSSNTSVAKKGALLWRDNIKHACHPLEESIQIWPQNPKRYRDVMEPYILGIKKLSLKILEMITQGLGVEKGYLEGISQVQFMSANYYPPCPDPSLTLGVPRHRDPSLITILYQGNIGGLQVVTRDGKWAGVEVVPNAFIVNIGTLLEIISNGKLRSGEHRVVTNAHGARTTIATFINPSPDCMIEPAKCLTSEANPPIYPSISFKEFITSSNAYGPYTARLFQNGSKKSEP